MESQKVNVEELNMALDSLLEESVEPVEDDDYPYDAVEREIYSSSQEEEERLKAYYKYLEENNTPPYNEGDIVQMRSALVEQAEDDLAVVLKVQMPPVYEECCPTCFIYCKGRLIQGYIGSDKSVIGSEIIWECSIPELDKKLEEYQKTVQ